jgi:Protein of unknown function (DUF1822)
MNLNLQELNAVFSDRIWLAIPDTEGQPSADRNRAFSNESARNTAQLNQWCLKGFLDWAREYLDLDEVPTIWPSEAELPSIWEFLTGTAIALGNKRLVLLPSDALDTEELTVPQEWVDIPEWKADYYVGVQVNPEAGWMQIWGYTSHRTLKTKGEYDPIYLTYGLERDLMLSDIDVLWVACSLDLNETVEIESIPVLSTAEANRFCGQLSQLSPYSPRLDLGFQSWAALITNDLWRQRLYQARLERAGVAIATPEPAAISTSISAQPLQNAVINVALWLQDQVDQVAQELSWVLLPAFAVEPIGLRGTREFQALETILAQLERTGARIPETARSACQDLQVGATQLRLYAVTWPLVSADKIPEWFLLLILSSQPNGTLSAGTKLLISDETQLLSKAELEHGSIDQYIYGGVSGTWSEVFKATITLADGTSLTLPEFGFNPEASV